MWHGLSNMFGYSLEIKRLVVHTFSLQNMIIFFFEFIHIKHMQMENDLLHPDLMWLLFWAQLSCVQSLHENLPAWIGMCLRLNKLGSNEVSCMNNPSVGIWATSHRQDGLVICFEHTEFRMVVQNDQKLVWFHALGRYDTQRERESNGTGTAKSGASLVWWWQWEKSLVSNRPNGHLVLLKNPSTH